MLLINPLQECNAAFTALESKILLWDIQLLLSNSERQGWYFQRDLFAARQLVKRTCTTTFNDPHINTQTECNIAATDNYGLDLPNFIPQIISTWTFITMQTCADYFPSNNFILLLSKLGHLCVTALLHTPWAHSYYTTAEIALFGYAWNFCIQGQWQRVRRGRNNSWWQRSWAKPEFGATKWQNPCKRLLTWQKDT